MCALPILGLLALGAGAGLRGQIGGMFDRQDARNFQRSGVDFRGRGLGQAGDLAQDIFSSGMGRRQGMQEMIGQTFGQQQADASNATRLQAASISAGPAYMNARLNQEKFALQNAEREAENNAMIAAGAIPEMINSPVYRQNFMKSYTGNADEIRHAGMTPAQVAEHEARRALIQQAEAAQSQATIRQNQEGQQTSELAVAAQNAQNQEIIDQINDPRWEPAIELSGADQSQLVTDIRDADSSEGILNDAIDFVEQNTRLGIAANPTERRALMAELQGPVLDTVRRLEQKGVLQGGEAEMLMNRLTVQGQESEVLGQLNSVLRQVQRARDNWYTQSELSVSPQARQQLGITARQREENAVPGSTDY